MIKNPISQRAMVRNPLTVIAIFAGLAEVCATISLPNLDDAVQLKFVWFVMIFPILLVALFFFTLWKKHQVLYAPSDFQDETNFMQLWKPSTRPLISDGDVGDDDEDDGDKDDESDAEEKRRQSQDKRYSKIAEIRLAEDLALNRMGQEYGVVFSRNMEFSSRKDIRFDGLAENFSGPILVEVKYIHRSSGWQDNFIHQMIQLISAAFNIGPHNAKNTTFIIAIVFSNDLDNEEVEVAKSRLKRIRDDANLPITVELKFFDFDELKHGAEV